MLKIVNCTRQMLCLGALCFTTASTQAVFAWDGANGVRPVLVQAACAGDCRGGSDGKMDTCGGEGCEAALPSRPAPSRKAKLATPVGLAAQTLVAESAAGNTEDFFIGVGDMSAGSWTQHER